MKFHVRISLTRDKYWFQIRDLLVPILLFMSCEEMVPVLHGVKYEVSLWFTRALTAI